MGHFYKASWASGPLKKTDVVKTKVSLTVPEQSAYLVVAGGVWIMIKNSLLTMPSPPHLTDPSPLSGLYDNFNKC